MADTLTFILDFLEKQKLNKAADALREEIKLKEKAFPGSPRLQATADDLDVSLCLRLSQDAGRLMSASSTGSQDSATPPLQHSPNSLLPKTDFSSTDAYVAAQKPPTLSLPAKGLGSKAAPNTGDSSKQSENGLPGSGAGSEEAGVADPAGGQLAAGDLASAAEGAAGGSSSLSSSLSSSSSGSGNTTPVKHKAALAPLPVAAPVATSSPPSSSSSPGDPLELPQLRPVRISSSGARSPGGSSMKLQPLAEVEAELEGEEEEEEQALEGGSGLGEGDTEGEGEGEGNSPAVSGVSEESKGSRGVSISSAGHAKGGEKDGGDPGGVPVVAMGEVVMDSQPLGPAESSSFGARKVRGSVSMLSGGTEAEDTQSVVSLSTDGAVAASEAQDSAWDSDTYDDEDDPGYTRQPVEDEEWFLLHEIDYPSEDDPHREEQEALLSLQAAGKAGGVLGSRGAEGEGVPGEEATALKGGSAKEASGGTGAEAGVEAGEGGESIVPEEEVYFSGEEYYQQPPEGELGLEGERMVPDGVGTWAGVLGEYRGRKDRRHRKGKKGRQGKEGDGEGEEEGEGEGDGEEGEGEGEDDEQLMLDARSVGVMSSDMADAGSSLRESVQGSDGDVDSVKGASSVRSARSRLGRRGEGEVEEGDEGEEEEGEEEDEEEEEGGEGSEVYESSPGARGRGEGEGEGEGEREDQEDGTSEGSQGKGRKQQQKRLGLSLGERKQEGKGDRPFGFRSLSEAGNQPAAEGGGLGGGGGFSFPSPSSHDGLSRMGSGRSGFSASDAAQDSKGLSDLALGEELDTLASAADTLASADDTLAAWKRHSASSSPILLSPSKGSDEGRGGGLPELSDQGQGREGGRAGGQGQKGTGGEGQKGSVGSKKVPGGEKGPALENAGAGGSAKEGSKKGGGTGGAPADLTARKGDAGSAAGDPEVATLVEATPGGGAAAAVSVGSGGAAPVTSAAKAAAAGAGGGASAEDGSEGAPGSGSKGGAGAEGQKSAKGGSGAAATAGGASETKEGKEAKAGGGTKTGAESEDFETFSLKIIHRKNRTGFEEEKDFPVVLNSVIAGRYYVTEYLGSAAFSKAIQAHDLHTGMDVCLKIIKNNKDFFDQSLDEVKLLKYVNRHDPADEHHILRLFDYFYHREHLFIICELLRANLYEFQKYNRDSGGEVYFTMPRLQRIAKQVLGALKFMHSLGLIHCDLKPENILIKSYSRCEVKVIDLGSSCFETDHLCTYVQSRSYRAPEVILGLPYGPKIDIWSLGCILAELCSGQVLFQNDSLATLLARVVGIIGPIDPQLLKKGRERHKFFTRNHMLYERNPETEQLDYLIPKRTTLRHRVPMGDPGFIDFVSQLLTVDPEKRPSAAEALNHPWLTHHYDTPL